jgi:uncharacterized membrane protein HdeD (DUF308 family)
MITFGYSNRVNGPLRALIAVAVGVLMIVYSDQAMNLVVKIIAAFILASGFVSLAVGLRRKDDSTSKLMNFNAVVDILIAAFLFVFNGFVANLIIYLIGFVLLCSGLFQLISLVSARRVAHLGLGSYLMPILVMGSGAFLLFNPEFTKSSISFIAGAALIVYGVSELFSSWKMKKAIDEYEVRRASRSDASQDVDENVVEAKDVDYEKVDEQ